MFSTRFVMRLAQAMLLLVLGLWVHTAQARTCRDCGACSGSYCGSDYRRCERCPVPWWGSCYAGSEGCGYYGCYDTPDLCCHATAGVCLTVCDCPRCTE